MGNLDESRSAEINAIMYGAGNLGRGFIAQRFFLSDYHTTFIDVNTAVVDAINGRDNDAEIKYFVTRALIESARALAKEHGAPIDDTLQFVEDLMVRFENKLLQDTAARVGRDPKRKLKSDDRLVGSFKLVRKHGGVPAHIAVGIAAGLLYDEPSDEAAVEISTFTRENGVAAALAKYSEVTDPADVAMIEKFCDLFRAKASFAEFVAVLGDLKRVEH